ncbi:MAG TPA: radical SAM protein [Azospirillum sp.]|nr:radical SAM protein [Azospirillum sp.]
MTAAAPSVAPIVVGHVDTVIDDRICGWAYLPEAGGPVEVEGLYDGGVYAQALADRFRSDLPGAGIGDGHHAWSLPLPVDTHTFDVDRFAARVKDGPALVASPTFLAWRPEPNPWLEGGAELDLLASPVTRFIHLEFTSRCNLRCVYCPVSQPDYHGQDLEIPDFDAIVGTLEARGRPRVVINGHGETTLLPGWHERVEALAARGFDISIISNFARLFSDEEVQALTRLCAVQISVDSHRPELLRRLRRKVDLGTILVNMSNVRARAQADGRPAPSFSWSCVVSDQVALDLVDYVRFGLASGVSHFTFCNLTQYPDIDGVQPVRHVTTLPTGDLRRFLDHLAEAGRIVAESGAVMEVAAGLTDTAEAELTRRAAA